MNLLYKEEAYRIIGALFGSSQAVGVWVLEAVYQEALEREFIKRRISFVREMELPIYYDGEKLKKHYQADFVCYDKTITEVKALSELTSTHEAQVLNYLKTTGFELGLLINFGQTSLKYKRISFVDT